jgi:leucyl aminopeptidase
MASPKNKRTSSKAENPKSAGKIKAVIWLYHKPEELKVAGFDKDLIALLKSRSAGKKYSYHTQTSESSFWFECTGLGQGSAELERLRKSGAAVFAAAMKESCAQVRLVDAQNSPDYTAAFLEGFMLASYRFDAFKTREPGVKVPEIVEVVSDTFGKKEAEALKRITEAVFTARDLVNQPSNHQTAAQLGKAVEQMGKEYGFTVDVWNMSRIRAQKFGGLLAVNRGSKQEPAFIVMNYKPAKAVNKKPIVLVGKGVVFDTGGLSLKPTPQSMDYMKCDMAGAAVVAGVFQAVAALKLPIYLVGLIPATDNRPGEEAICPGDIIDTHKGLTVEVLNTDAEGRLILADALSYASKYEPELLVDFATLTGAAARALGTYGSALMGNADEVVKENLKNSGDEVYERLAELPLWEEYADEMNGDISDLKNLGKAEGGAQTAAMFLRNFTDYPWLHLDIAGTAFSHQASAYITKGGTGVGVRLMVSFLRKRIAYGS